MASFSVGHQSCSRSQLSHKAGLALVREPGWLGSNNRHDYRSIVGVGRGFMQTTSVPLAADTVSPCLAMPVFPCWSIWLQKPPIKLSRVWSPALDRSRRERYSNKLFRNCCQEMTANLSRLATAWRRSDSSANKRWIRDGSFIFPRRSMKL